MFGQQPLPFIPYPTRMESFRFTSDDLNLLDLPLWAVEKYKADLKWKLDMEMARLWRLLPDAPKGFTWDMQVEAFYDPMHATYTHRVIARFKETS